MGKDETRAKRGVHVALLNKPVVHVFGLHLLLPIASKILINKMFEKVYARVGNARVCHEEEHREIGVGHTL